MIIIENITPKRGGHSLFLYIINAITAVFVVAAVVDFVVVATTTVVFQYSSRRLLLSSSNFMRNLLRYCLFFVSWNN